MENEIRECNKLPLQWRGRSSKLNVHDIHARLFSITYSQFLHLLMPVASYELSPSEKWCWKKSILSKELILKVLLQRFIPDLWSRYLVKTFSLVREHNLHPYKSYRKCKYVWLKKVCLITPPSEILHCSVLSSMFLINWYRNPWREERKEES